MIEEVKWRTRTASSFVAISVWELFLLSLLFFSSTRGLEPAGMVPLVVLAIALPYYLSAGAARIRHVPSPSSRTARALSKGLAVMYLVIAGNMVCAATPVVAGWYSIGTPLQIVLANLMSIALLVLGSEFLVTFHRWLSTIRAIGRRKDNF